MRFYRVYTIDSTDSVIDVSFFKAADDRDVLAQAMIADLAPMFALEIWDQRRFVGCLASSEHWELIPAISGNAPDQLPRYVAAATLATCKAP